MFYDYLIQVAGVYTHYVFYTCSRVSFARHLFNGIIIGVLGLLLVCALFVAFKTRKVKVKGLNESKYITAIVYLSTLCKVLVLIVIFTLRSHVNIFPVALSGIFMSLATFALAAVFLPKVKT